MGGGVGGWVTPERAVLVMAVLVVGFGEGEVGRWERSPVVLGGAAGGEERRIRRAGGQEGRAAAHRLGRQAAGPPHRPAAGLALPLQRLARALPPPPNASTQARAQARAPRSSPELGRPRYPLERQ